MIKVITYGTYDLLHYGHIKLLENAKALGDYLIVAVTSDDYDKTRGKINNRQSLMERIEAVKSTGLADEIIVEEYEGQKIDDIKKYNIDIFTVGSDWEGKFDYLNEFCKVVYLPRTQGVSSSEIRDKNNVKMGFVGENAVLTKFLNESRFVNGIDVVGVCTHNNNLVKYDDLYITDDYESLLEKVDAVYLVTHPKYHYKQIKIALEKGKHVMCESPITCSLVETNELFELADRNNCILYDSIKTAYSTAYNRLLLLIKSGKIGVPVSVDATCTCLTSLDFNNSLLMENIWNSTVAWGPTTLLPVFQILGTNYSKANIMSKFNDLYNTFDDFTKIDFVFDSSVATIKVGKGVKSEGELVVTGTKGYIYVPAPWWKTDYFEVRYEDQSSNKRYYYQLDGEGIRYELVSFVKSIINGYSGAFISKEISLEISRLVEKQSNSSEVIRLK